jgi:hypothetical protein
MPDFAAGSCLNHTAAFWIDKAQNTLGCHYISRAAGEFASPAAAGVEAMPAPRGGKDQEDDTTTPLTISPETVCFIIVKAREFDAKDAVTEPDPASNPTDDRDVAVLEDHADDPVVEELTWVINSLSEDEQVDLVALMWLGRDDYTRGDWPGLREEAAGAHNRRRTATYLLGTPLLGDFLEEGLSMLGYSCAEFEMGHL